MLYNHILLKMAGIRLIDILCVLLMFSDKISEIFFAVFLTHLEHLHLKEAVTAMCLNIQIQLFFFLGCYMVPTTKKWRHRNKPGTNFGICTYDERVRII